MKRLFKRYFKILMSTFVMVVSFIMAGLPIALAAFYNNFWFLIMYIFMIPIAVILDEEAP